MKMFIALTLLIALIIALAAISCIGETTSISTNATNGSQVIISNNSQSAGSTNATATFGAQQYHIQLTAVAGQNP
jgi:hypothetical protein